MKKIFLIIGMFFLVGTFGMISAEKIWTFNNYTLNISDNIYFGGNIFGDGSGLTNLNVSALNLSDYIPYTGSSKNVVLGDYNFSVGTSDFFVNSNGNVGIGTTSPGYFLDVTGDIRGTTDFILGGNSDRRRVINIYYNPLSWPLYSSSITQTGASDEASGTRGLVINENQGQAVSNYGIGFALNNSNKMFIQYTGNVGIGTTSPTQKLEVNGSANVTGNMTIGNAQVYTDTSGDMVFRV